MSPERERSGGWHLQGMIFISLLLHGAILSFVLLSPSFPSPKLTFGPVYTVSLVSLPGNVLVQKNESADARELMAEERPEQVFKKRLDPAAAIPIRPVETRKKQDTGLEKAMEEIRKKAAVTETPRQTQAKAVPAKAVAPPAAPSAAPGGNAEVNAQMSAYDGQIFSRIRRGWAIPQGILQEKGLVAVIHVTILRSGAVTEINFEKRSGNRYFDDYAMKAVRKAIPFPPLPAGIGANSIDRSLVLPAD